jgi:hypothetical protein
MQVLRVLLSFRFVSVFFCLCEARTNDVLCVLDITRYAHNLMILAFYHHATPSVSFSLTTTPYEFTGLHDIT